MSAGLLRVIVGVAFPIVSVPSSTRQPPITMTSAVPTAVTPLTLTLTGQATQTCNAADVNCDGSVNGGDVAPFVALLLGGGSGCSACAGDFNADQTLDGEDIMGFVAALIP